MDIKRAVGEAHMEMRNTFLVASGKGISGKHTELGYAVMWKAKLVNDEFRYLAEISKHGGSPCGAVSSCFL